jgi:HAD superfamily hydrolase (TIGR01490 family)
MNQPDGAGTRLALFDLDHTLLPLDSDYEWGEFTLRKGWCDKQAFGSRNAAFFADYQKGTLDIHAYVRFATEAIRKLGQQAADEAHRDFMQEVIEPHIQPAARALLQQHRDAGDTIVIVTATNEFVTRPIARALGVEHLLAVNLARDASGWITGEIEGVPTMRAGKVTRMEAWMSERGLRWDSVDSIFYSDSMNDVPLLEKVNTAVATNPDDRLRQLAAERGWRILDLLEPHA